MYFRSFTYERFIKPVSMNGTIIKSISYSIKSIRDLIVRLRRNEFSGLSVYLIRTENEKQFESYRVSRYEQQLFCSNQACTFFR